MLMTSTVFAQNDGNLGTEQKTDAGRSFIFGTSIGYPLGIFDIPNAGIYVGIHPRWRISDIFWIDTQISYSHSRFDRDDDIFSHDGGQTNSYSAIFGPRLYMMGSNKNIRPYANLLIGYGATVDQEYNADDELKYATFGVYSFSFGIYLEINKRFFFGGAVEGAHTEAVVKLGYNL